MIPMLSCPLLDMHVDVVVYWQVALAERYQQEKHAEEKSILVKQVDSLTDRHNKASKDLQETQVENARLLSQLKNTLGE